MPKEESITPEMSKSDTQEDKTKKIAHRRKHKNSRLGCPQCRQRRIKCDEALPSCRRCMGRKVHCGYLDYTQEQKDQIIEAHLLRQNTSSFENINIENQVYQQPQYYAQQPVSQPIYYQVNHIQPQPYIIQQDYTLSNENLSIPNFDQPKAQQFAQKSPQSTDSVEFDSTLTSVSANSTQPSPSMNVKSKLLVESYIHPIEDLARKFSNNSISIPKYQPKKVNSIPEPYFNRKTKKIEVPLISHKLNNTTI